MGKAPSATTGGLQGIETLGGTTAGQTLPLAVNYYTSLLQGGPAAEAAVAPSAEAIAQEYQGAKSSIENFMPAGGERNLALEQLPIAKTRDIARLTAGVQPAAAQALTRLGLGAGQLGTSAGADLLQYYSNLAQSIWGSIGQGLGGAASGAGTMLGMKGEGSKAGGKGASSGVIDALAAA